MAASKNKVNLMGSLGADPEIRYTAAGKATATIRLATTETWKDRESGEKQEKTTWHRLVAFEPLSKIVEKYLKKGSHIDVEGKITYRKFQKDGADQWITEIVLDELKMLGSPQRSGAPNQPPADSTNQKPDSAGGGGGGPSFKPGGFDDMGDDIPFVNYDMGMFEPTRRMRHPR